MTVTIFPYFIFDSHPIISMVRYSRNVGVKFHSDGTARRFPGNTIICHVPQDSAVYSILKDVRDDFMSHKWAFKFAFLPPSSYHMTIFEGICDQRRESRNWPKNISSKAPLVEVDSTFARIWKKVDKPNSIFMKYDSFWGFENITLKLKAHSSEMNKILRSFRDTLASQFALKFPGHKLYTFHISLAYRLQNLNFFERREQKKLMKAIDTRLKNEFGILELYEPELTFFEDMTNFAPSREQATPNCRE